MRSSEGLTLGRLTARFARGARLLHAFVATLEKAGELRRIAAPVATELEITALADREMKSPGGGRALLFEHPTIDGRPSRFPLAINTMGSHRRMDLALGTTADDLANRCS